MFWLTEDILYYNQGKMDIFYLFLTVKYWYVELTPWLHLDIFIFLVENMVNRIYHHALQHSRRSQGVNAGAIKYI